MTSKELERRMAFIVEQQAHFAAHISELREADVRLRESQATLTASLVRMAELMEEQQRRTDERLATFDERLATLDERLATLAETQRSSDERLNALIDLFEKHITGPDHGGKVSQ